MKSFIDLVVEVIQYIYNNVMSQVQFMELLKEGEGNKYNDYMFFVKICWLNSGRVL